ncbi:methionine ABC transporter ATP-binding protein [Cryobacterium sp. PAMC25264]|uniref:methionine ABC transporter ATP-binding protein n=1 Tax=Cryobacterium sp. PAMC25264 TaxID=2861288 RepID=UPI001C63882A|nr:ATP-binding cassette domain-containing protein [Cryobacterium sp. PAMC25264]QYF73087.1 ATP-binding cassette domain-containing protein [Cryobacterium sp. PAMC25264]
MISLEQLTKVYGHGTLKTVVLDRLDFSVDAGEIFAVVGPSGAGKSTLAQCVNLLERPTSGSVLVNGENLSQLSEKALRVARRRIGTIFQSDGLYSRRTAAANVSLPLEYLGVTAAETRARVAELLDRVGLSNKAEHYPHQLSGGQRQRVGIARALALRPSVLLSDEATSGLDPDSTRSIVALLKELRDDLGLSILFITHEMDTVLQVADSVARLDHGRIVESGRIVELLRDPASGLGRALRPARSHESAAADATEWFVSYTSAHVPADWLTRLADQLGTTVSLLGASIETVDGATVGHASIGVTGADREHLITVARSLGLDARPGPAGESRPAELLEQVA